MKKKILILAAHPDDETLGCGASIAKLSKEGHDINLLTFTDGESSRNKKNKINRNKCLEDVSKILGINNYSFGNFPDNQMDSVPMLKICKFIEKKITFTPDIIFTHHPKCLNIDHTIIYRATITVFRPQEGLNVEINCYPIPSSTEWNPYGFINFNLYYNVENFIEQKIKAMKVYEKEMRPYPHPRSYESIKNYMKLSGNEVGLKYCEKFQSIRKVIN